MACTPVPPCHSRNPCALRRLPSSPPARRADRSGAARAQHALRARRLYRAVDALRHHRQIEPGPAFRHGRADRLVARSGARLRQASAARRRAGVAVVQRLPGGGVVLLPARHADAGAGAVDRLAAFGRLSRWRQARRRRGAAHAGAVLQFPCAQIQRQHGAAAAMGGGDFRLPAQLSHARRRMGGACRRAGGGLHAGEILVGVSARRPCIGRADRCAPRALFPLAGAMDHGGGRRARPGAASRLAGRSTVSRRLPMRSAFTPTSRSPRVCCARWAISPARSAMARCRSLSWRSWLGAAAFRLPT